MLLFFYGTLMAKHSRHNGEMFADHGAVSLGNAWTRGKMFDTGWYPAVTLEDYGRIEGELWSVNTEKQIGCSLIEHMNRYEGYNTKHPEKSLFIPKPVTVTIDGKPMVATAYIYNKDTSGFPVIEDGDFLSHVQMKRGF